MNTGIIAKALGVLLFFLAIAGLVPLLCDLIVGAPITPWLIMVGAAFGTGAVLILSGWRSEVSELRIREGMAVTTLTWVVFSLVAGLGIYLAAPTGISYVNGWFEAMSGFTTTGSSIFGQPFARIEDLSPGLLLWRSLIQWMGGIGIVVISLALLPLLMGGGGFQLYRAEVPGVDKDRLAPRIRDTARIMVIFYLALTATVVVGLIACGVGPFDAVCHTFTCVSTGGFSPYDDSIEGLGSHAAEWVLIGGMFVSGINFSLLLAAIRGRHHRLWRSAEVRLYIGFVVTAWLVVLFEVGVQGLYYVDDLHGLVRDTLFQVVSMATTTGFGTGFDSTASTGGLGWDAWPAGARMALLLLMVGGACAGSTAGGIKMVRYLVALKGARRELRRYMEPARITPVRLDSTPIRDPVVLQVGAFILIYSISWGLGTLAISLLGSDLDVAASAALSALSNIGPGIGAIGPSQNYHTIGEASQIVCLALMLLGRLEFFGVLMTLRPRHWRR